MAIWRQRRHPLAALHVLYSRSSGLLTLAGRQSMDYADYPRHVVEDIVRLRRRLDSANIPPRRSDHNLLIGTWNIRAFGRVHPQWDENTKEPKRNLRALACIAEVVRRFDVMAIQEVKRDTSGIRMLVK